LSAYLAYGDWHLGRIESCWEIIWGLVKGKEKVEVQKKRCQKIKGKFGYREAT
jgi:hypothetical protein